MTRDTAGSETSTLTATGSEPAAPPNDSTVADDVSFAALYALRLQELEPAQLTLDDVPGPWRHGRRDHVPTFTEDNRLDMVPRLKVTRNRHLSLGARVLFAEIQGQIGEAGDLARRRRAAPMAVELLGANIGVSQAQVRRYLAELVEQRLIVIEHRPGATSIVRVLWKTP